VVYLVTGGAGFIGKHLVHCLLAERANVRIIDTFSRLGPTDMAHPRLEVIGADIRDISELRRTMQGCSVVFHLAADATVMGCEQDPDHANEVNAGGTYNVLRMARELGVHRVVVASSREVYGEPTTLPVSESASIQPKNVYGCTKAAAEMYCNWAASFMQVSVLRLTNVIGPGDTGRVIPRFLASARSQSPLVVYGGNQVLDFVGVDVVTRAFLRVACGEYVPGAVNVGSGRGTSVLEAASRVIAACTSSSELQILPSRDVEVTKFIAATNRMAADLGIAPDDDPWRHLLNIDGLPCLRTDSPSGGVPIAATLG
jgi:UDP-glucose 4-epimerase